MTNLQEEPAVPPFDPQGDERAGYFAAGGLLVVLGWGLGVLTNVIAHLSAPAGGTRWWGVYIGPELGAYAWGVLGLGLFAGAFGVVLIGIGRGSPRGPMVLPGYDY